VLIPARGGSKGIPLKNIKPLAGKPLIYYSIDIARQILDDKHICISTDDNRIIEKVEEYGLTVPFVRPEVLATDTSTSNDVLIHALTHYEEKEVFYDAIILLQPTSPLRTLENLKEALLLYNDTIDMVVSVRQSHSAAVICKEEDGYLVSALNERNFRRQDINNYFEYNGAIYIINAQRLKEKGLNQFTKILKYEMSDEKSIDIDSMFDWKIAEMVIENQKKS
jgi:CMP-N,N'-diacetyllegionaminic acid synthase